MILIRRSATELCRLYLATSIGESGYRISIGSRLLHVSGVSQFAEPPTLSTSTTSNNGNDGFGAISSRAQGHMSVLELEVQVSNDSGPVVLYEHRLSTGQLRPDENQRKVVELLQSFYRTLQAYKPPQAFITGPSFISKLFETFGSRSGSKTQTHAREEIKKFSNSPLGLYLYGGVGCGKTMLMDLFFESCGLERKSRVHFYEFMRDVHHRIHDVKQAMGVKNYNLNRSQPYDPIAPVAQEISRAVTLLCFDEFQVTDIADAMIIKRLFSHLWQNGVIVFATSNRKPDDLYKNGLQRIHFLPFIPMLKMNCDVQNMTSIDYRLVGSAAEERTFFSATECDIKFEMDRQYEELVSRESSDTLEGPQTIEVLGRKLTFDNTCGEILDTTFHCLCARPLGAADYIEIAKKFRTILIRDVPRLTLGQRSEARRFITLIDTLYDMRVRCVFSAERCLADLFAKMSDATVSEYDRHHTRVLIGDLNIKVGEDNASASLFTGEEELFAFERVSSRMTEMGTRAYWTASRNFVLGSGMSTGGTSASNTTSSSTSTNATTSNMASVT